MSAPHGGAAARPVPERVATLDRLLVELGRMRHRLVYPLARAASDLEQSSGWTVFGYLTREDFARAMLGRSGRWLRDLATLQDKMEALPALGRAVGGLDGGAPLGRVAALWVARVARPEDVDTWIARARCLTLRRLRSAVEEAAAESQSTSPVESVETEIEKENFTLELTPDESLAIDEAKDLLSAVMGREVSQEEFFEALLAEATAGPWNPEFIPTPRPRSAAGPPPVARDLESVAARAEPASESSPSSLVDFEPKTTAERHALRTLKRMMEITRDLLQATRRVSENSAQNPRALDPVVQAARAPQTSALDAVERVAGALEAGAKAADAPVPETSAPATRPLDAWELEVRAELRALEAGVAPSLNAGTTSLPSDSGRFRIREVIRIVYHMRELVHLEDEIEIRIADLLHELMDQRAWRCLGYTGLAEYAEERLGLGRTAAHGRVRLARGLRRLPQVRAAYEAGRIGMEEAGWIVRYLRSAHRDAIRAPDAILQEAANEHAETTTIKRLGDERRMLEEKELSDLIALAREVSKRRAGRGCLQPAAGTAASALPGAAAAMDATAAATAALGSADDHGGAVAIDAAAAVGSSPSAADEETGSAPSVGCSPAAQGAAPQPGASFFPDDAVWHAFLRREPGQARRRVLGLGHGQLERVTRRWALLERPRSWPVSPDLNARLRATLCVAGGDLSRRAQAYADHISPAEEARLLPTERMALEYHRRRQPLRRGVALLALVEEFVRVWDDPAGMTRRPLDAIHNRTGWRCTAPGCTARRNLQVHHICHRSLGGGDEDWNETSVCAFHHLQGEHGRYARCRGRAPLDVVWRLGVAELNIWYQNERRIRPPEAFSSA